MIVHVELAVLAVVDGKVSTMQLSCGAEYKFVFLVREKKLAIGRSLRCSIACVPRVLFLFHLLKVIKLSVHLRFPHVDHCNARDRSIHLTVIVCLLVAVPSLQGVFT